MIHGLRTGMLHLKTNAGNLVGTLLGFGHGSNNADAESLTEHDLRDLGLLEGRQSPSTVRRGARPDAWDIIEEPPRWL